MSAVTGLALGWSRHDKILTWGSVVVLLLFSSGCRLASDDALIEQWRTNSGALEKLVECSFHDEIQIVDPKRSVFEATNALDAQRREMYAELLGSAGVRTLWIDKNGVVFMEVGAVGMAGSAARNGFAYSPSPPGRVVSDLRDAGISSRETAFRHIEGAWYLYGKR